MNKKPYFSPVVRVVALLHQQHILAGSGEQTQNGPSATFMSDPTFENE